MSKTIRQEQALAILTVLEEAGRDLLIERTPTGWRVECQGPSGDGQCGHSHDGETVIDALGQFTTVLAIDALYRVSDELSEESCGYVTEEPVEFATVWKEGLPDALVREGIVGWDFPSYGVRSQAVGS